jgi:ribonuclease BN (tRNA processing enzyme)
MISMELFDIRPNTIDMILVSHLHGDHFGGLPFLILDAQMHSKRTEPLLVAGPEGSKKRINLAMEVMFPGSSKVQRKFHTEWVELQPGKRWDFRDVTVLPTLVNHPSGDPSLAFRVESCQKTIVYTGDTEWTETLIPLLVDADLLIAETYFYAKQVKYHMNYETLRSHLDELYPKRVLITHMSPDMLSKLDEINLEAAEDGMVVEV